MAKAAESKPILSVSGIRKSFGNIEVLRGIDLSVNAGEIVCIVGPSGAGKTTLLQIMGTLDSADSGTVIIDGTDIAALSADKLARFRNERIGFVFQFHQLLPEFTALENVMIPALLHGDNTDDVRRRASILLQRMGLADREGHKPSELSGGEKQRVAVARALVNKPSVIFADEPSGSLDSSSRQQLHKLLFELRDETGVTLVIVTHDEQLATSADRTIHIADGVITAH